MDATEICAVVVEDDDDLRDELVSFLESCGCLVVGVPDGAALFRELMRRRPDVVILDVELPGENGFTIARHLRAIDKTNGIGIIMLTGRGDKSSKIDGLQSGADMYLVKPVDLDELGAYIDSLYRRFRRPAESANGATWRYLRSEAKLITPTNTVIDLSHMENLFVDIIARHTGQAVKRRDIIASAFGLDPVEYDWHRLEVLVSRLRKKIHKHYPTAQPIKAAHAVGYSFAAPLVVV